MPLVYSLWCVAALLGLAGVAVGLGRHKAGNSLVYGASSAVSAFLLVNALRVLLTAAPAVMLTLPFGVPWVGAHFRLDALSAFFLVVVNLGGLAASFYALGYGRHEQEPQRVLPFYAAFLAAMNLVLLVDDAFSFLVGWEVMALASWALVAAHHRDPENLRASYIYIVMASVGTLALLLAFGLLAGPEGGYGFQAMRGHHASHLFVVLILLLALFGAGSKAGLVPLHVWLPLAHPAAPSHVSALMSGVMTKVAIYGFVRIVFDLLGPPEWWWGIVILLAGGATAVLGVLYALMEHDLKRLLAYHTVENIGIIFIGLGLALAFKANGLVVPAALALTAALFHVFNHSLFKSLLFFGAGSILGATGERDLEHMGGLIHPMPLTAVSFLIGCVAISALPPLNGFVSEWLTFQAILQSPEMPQWTLKIAVPAVGGLLALSAALAAACFVKAYGIGFLGRPRTPAAATARETDGFSLTAMFALAALCCFAGILPGFVIDALAPVMRSFAGTQLPTQTGMAWLSIVPIAAGKSSYDPLLIFAFILIAAMLAALGIHLFASRALRRAPAWDCGFPDANPITQYSASSFAQPIRRVFGTRAFRAREHVEMPPPGDQRPARFHVELHDLIWESIYEPIARWISLSADWMNRFQFLTIRRYLSLVFLSLVSLLVVLALW